MLDSSAYGHLLRRYTHMAVVGLSANPARPSSGVARYLQAAGYDIIPINPRYAGQELLGRRVYATLSEARDAGETIEIVDVFRLPQYTPPLAAEAARAGAKVLWLQLGISNAETARLAREHGLIYVEDRCTKIEHARLALSTSDQTDQNG
jgi:predicted CoA-binding protein